MKSVLKSLCVLACIGLSSVLAAVPLSSDGTNHWIDIDGAAPEVDVDHQAHCAKEERKVLRKSLWASFWLGFASGMGNSTLARREADVKFTDREGNTSRGTITFTDPNRYAYLRDRDRQYNLLKSSQVAANHMQKAGCKY